MSHQQLFLVNNQQLNLEIVMEDFLRSREDTCNQNTIQRFYAPHILEFITWCENTGIKRVDDITIDHLRLFRSSLTDHHNEGGQHMYYRVIKTFMLWYEVERDPEWKKNPIRLWKSRLPKAVPLPGVTIATVIRMAEAVDSQRDKALLLFLVETGVRATELRIMKVCHFEPILGGITVIHGKGDKTRTIYVQSRAKRELKKYLRSRNYEDNDPLFVTVINTRFTYWGLREIIERASKKIGLLKVPGLHDFRRCCGLNLFRNGMDILLVSRWLGHNNIEVTKRYLRLTDEDLRLAQIKASPVENWYKKG